MAEKEPKNAAPGMSAFFEGYATGSQERTAWCVMMIDQIMSSGIRYRDQEILMRLREEIFKDTTRRYPGFDLEHEARKHAP